MENIKKIFCYNCQCETKQKVLFEKGEIRSPEVVPFSKDGKRMESIWTIEAIIYKISECQGCEKVNFNALRRIDPTKDDLLIHQYPSKQIRHLPKWVLHLNKEYISLFIEVYESLNSGHFKLPLMGARTLLDMYIVEKIGDIGTFKNKLKKLLDEKIITQSSKELLEVALEYGHATIHRGYQAEKEEIMGVLDIIENLFESEALLDKTKKLKRTIPK